MLRQGCRVDGAAVPEETTLRRWANLRPPAPLPRLLDPVVALAQSLKVPHGRKLRIAGPVVGTHSPHPTDGTVLYEGGRGLGRRLTKAKRVVQQATPLARAAFRERTRRAQRQRQRLMAAAQQRGAQADDRMRSASPRLLTLTTARVAQAEQVGAVRTAQATHPGHQLAAPLRPCVPWVRQVVPQTTRRGSQGEAVPAPEQVVSRFEPHTAIIRTGKPGRPTACGRGLWLDAVDGGILSRDAVRHGNPAAEAQGPLSVDQQRRVCKRPPQLLAGDRGVHTTANARYATTHGGTRGVLPPPGAKSATRLAQEQPRGCRRGHNWRAGIEGRSSGLKRRHKLDRCRYHGPNGRERGVGWGVIAHALRVIAQAMAP